MNVVSATGGYYFRLPQEVRDSVSSWLREHGLDPGRVQGFAVDGDLIYVDYLRLNDAGHYHVDRWGRLAREELCVPLRSAAPVA